MATGYMARLRERPQQQRNAIFLTYCAVMMAIIGVVVLMLTPKDSFVGYAAFAAAAVELAWAAVSWSRRSRV